MFSKGYWCWVREIDVEELWWLVDLIDVECDALEGVDVEECRTDDDDCQTLTCKHHGVCS